MFPTIVENQKELIATLILSVSVMILIGLLKFILKRFAKVAKIDWNNRKVVFYIGSFLIYTVAVVIGLLIWGVNFNDFIVFISSTLAVIGIGLFAQWSVLSNVTASVILFFSHPLRLGDRVQILDKDFNWTGVVEDITAFYLFMKTDEGKKITLPTNLVIQKALRYCPVKQNYLKLAKRKGTIKTDGQEGL